MWMHKEKRHINDPTEEEMIGTKRFVELVKTSSISEPLKKKKKVIEEKSSDEETDMKKRSEQKDQKILEKRKKAEDEEEKLTAINDLKTKNIELQKSEEKKNSKKETPKDPINIKDCVKDNKVVEKTQHPKLRRLPRAVDCLHPNSLEYLADGNGACCVNCVAMWIFLNETEMGPQTDRDLNTFIALYRDHYEPLMEFPMDIVIGVGGKRIRFEKGEEESFFNPLVSSQEMSFMWRNGFDIQALTDMTNMPIEVTLYDPATHLVENIQTFQPSPNFPWKENDSTKPVTHKYNKTMIKFINYKNTHFNLIVGEDDVIVNMLVPKENVTQNFLNKEVQSEENQVVKDLRERLKVCED